jgi:hypothetical protein
VGEGRDCVKKKILDAHILEKGGPSLEAMLLLLSFLLLVSLLCPAVGFMPTARLGMARFHPHGASTALLRLSSSLGTDQPPQVAAVEAVGSELTSPAPPPSPLLWRFVVLGICIVWSTNFAVLKGESGSVPQPPPHGGVSSVRA